MGFKRKIKIKFIIKKNGLLESPLDVPNYKQLGKMEYQQGHLKIVIREIEQNRRRK